MSRATVSAECGISERSTYRYVRSLSEAGFPVYWDDELKGYRLNFQKRISLESFDIAETAMLALAIVVLRSHCDDIYAAEADDLYRKVIASVSIPLDDILRSSEAFSAKVIESSEVATLLTRLIVQSAASSKTPIRIRSRRQRDRVVDYNIREPQLMMTDEWKVVDGASAMKVLLPLADVTFAAVARPRVGPQSPGAFYGE